MTATAEEAHTSEPTEEQQTRWVDLLPPGSPEPAVDHLVTRPQLFDRLSTLGIDLEERTLMSWEAAGALPRALRRWRDGRPHALYPEGWESAVYLVLDLQKQGWSLAQIADIVRRTPFAELTRRDWVAVVTEQARTAVDRLAAELERETGRPIRYVPVTMMGAAGNEEPGGFVLDRVPTIVPKGDSAS
jgi:hypothetical protein